MTQQQRRSGRATGSRSTPSRRSGTPARRSSTSASTARASAATKSKAGAGETRQRRPKGTAKATTTLGRIAARVVVPSLAVICVAIVLGYAVFPTRTWLEQRDTIADREATLAELEAETAELAALFTLLGTDVEIERLARVDHGLVMPGEEAFAILPRAPEPVRLPPSWPFVGLADVLDG